MDTAHFTIIIHTVYHIHICMILSYMYMFEYILYVYLEATKYIVMIITAPRCS